MPVLTSSQRKLLEEACLRGRRASEQAVRSALASLAVTADRPPAHLNDDARRFRRGLRAKARQLGDEGDGVDLLVADSAFEQWHRLLFARFLAENGLLIHPGFGVPVSLEDCEEIAELMGEPDGWSVAGRLAAQILPGIFRLADPSVQLRLAPEGRVQLETIVAGLPSEVFTAADALGWVYQFWQSDRKIEVNQAGSKIGATELPAVTQLFTEDYMVRFLLENSLGAWWAVRHPESPIVTSFKYLRVTDDGVPAAGTFNGWPESVAEVTVMDPCCGSGHFLIVAFEMLTAMRMEEEGLSRRDAGNAVIAENLFGLEIDPRCTQIAAFALALSAWKGGGYRELPPPNIACSGIRVVGQLIDWTKLASGDTALENALATFHELFRDAPELGSLIDPHRATEGGHLFSVDYKRVAPLLERLLARETHPEAQVAGWSAAGIARAAALLARTYTLVATNVPYLQIGKQSQGLRAYIGAHHVNGRADLATAFLERCQSLTTKGGSVATVSPQSWLTLGWFQVFRESLLSARRVTVVAALGSRAFSSIGGEVVNVVLTILGMEPPKGDSSCVCLDADAASASPEKAIVLATGALAVLSQRAQRDNPDSRILLEPGGTGPLLEAYAESYRGLGTADQERFIRRMWEVPQLGPSWAMLQTTVAAPEPYGGRSDAVLWEDGRGRLEQFARLNPRLVKGTHRRGNRAWGRSGVLVSQMGALPASLYGGDLFDSNAAVVLPKNDAHLLPLWAFCNSPEYTTAVRRIDKSIKVTSATLIKVPFDLDHWCQIGAELYPNGLPEPYSNDPTQWLFKGNPADAAWSLQVAVARLLGYKWSGGEPDALDAFVDDDGIVCLASVRGERQAAERLQELVARAFGGTWTPARTRELIAESGSDKKDLVTWLRDDFFKQHCALFQNRPFVWHIWDGRKDGFSAVVNYHRLNKATLSKVAYSYLGDWIERQESGARDDVPGADERVVAARALRSKLELILEGEPPYDIYVRWKALSDQAIGWNPDIDDGVRLNVRPFVKADVLRSKFNVKWERDRGKNADGSDRLNDLHFTHAEKLASRQRDSA